MQLWMISILNKTLLFFATMFSVLIIRITKTSATKNECFSRLRYAKSFVYVRDYLVVRIFLTNYIAYQIIIVSLYKNIEIC